MNKKILNYTIYYGLFISWFFLFLTGIGQFTTAPQENLNDIIVFLSIFCLIISYYFEKVLIKMDYNLKTLLTPRVFFLMITIIWYIRYKFF